MKKTIAERMLELEKALRALQLANNHFFQSRDDAYLLLTQAQLRALLVSGPTMSPLLSQLAASVGIALEFFALPAPASSVTPNLAASIVTMKSDIVHGLTFTADEQIESALRDYVPFYNGTRLHSALNYVPPATFERLALESGVN